jgi:hypothetical protein
VHEEAGSDEDLYDHLFAGGDVGQGAAHVEQPPAGAAAGPGAEYPDALFQTRPYVNLNINANNPRIRFSFEMERIAQQFAIPRAGSFLFYFLFIMFTNNCFISYYFGIFQE